MFFENSWNNNMVNFQILPIEIQRIEMNSGAPIMSCLV